ncbi:MAG TPA: STAS domain-containing protein [Bacteriovoracaceae bacterium]|nr:STAS domain-containing protein [Bacteriovoracaceae bacterium]
MAASSKLFDIYNKHSADLLTSWEAEQKASIRADLIKVSELREQSKEFLRLFGEALSRGNFKNIQAPEWALAREFLTSISHSRGLQGYTPSETATFVFSLKKSFMNKVRQEGGATAANMDEVWELSDLLDKLGLYTTEVHQKAREELINRQQLDMLELSTPVVELAEGIIALPMIGTLDSHRTQIVMETLLQRIVETSASIAIIDITGVPTVDTLVAQHLLKTVTAAKLMGTECIISGIRPQIAATIVHLGVDLGTVITKASLASAFHLALKKTGFALVKTTGHKV